MSCQREDDGKWKEGNRGATQRIRGGTMGQQEKTAREETYLLRPAGSCPQKSGTVRRLLEEEGIAYIINPGAEMVVNRLRKTRSKAYSSL